MFRLTFNSIFGLFVLVLVITLNRSSAFNFDTQSPLFKHGAKGSYFGFSIALHHVGKEKNVLVGAPLADLGNIRKSGAVHKCSLDRIGTCSPLLLDRRGEQTINGRATESKSGQWLGASIATSATGSLMACAPRYVSYSVNLKRREPVGLCYLARTLNSDPIEVSPCKIKEQWGYHRLGSCQAGFAGTITQNAERFYVTAPGSIYWQGQVYAFNNTFNPNRNDAYLATKDLKPEDDDTYMGYSITHGQFSSTGDGLDIAVGVPKGSANLTGKIMLFNSKLQAIGSLVGEQTGSYFGYSVASLDADGDGRTDLAVGAPMFSQFNSNFEFEQGRVYVYYRRKHLNMFDERVVLDGPRSRARFGMALASLGDQLGERAESLAVGAPYDGPDGRGCVYIYHGRPGHGLRTPAAQVLTPEQFQTSPIGSSNAIRTFGFSLASGNDINDDQLSDLAIGAYASDTALVVRSRPIVNATPTLRLNPSTISLENRDCTGPNRTRVPCVQIDFCLSYTGSRVIPDHLQFRWNVTLDSQRTQTPFASPRMFLLTPNTVNHLQSHHQGLMSIAKGMKSKCTSFTAYISEVLRDKLNPILVKLDYDIVAEHSQLFETSPPILNQFVSQRLEQNVTIKKNCGRDNVCIPDLRLKVTSNVDTYVLGANEKLRLNVVIENAGEDAFESMLFLQLPPDVNLVQIDQTKSMSKVTWQEYRIENTGQSKIDFDLGNPLPANKTVRLTIELTAKDTLSISTSSFDFRFNLTSSNSESDLTLTDNSLFLQVPLRVNVKIEPYGQSYVDGLPQALIHNVSTELGFMGRKERYQLIRHAYFLKNKGPTTIKEMQITILWPEKSIEGKNLFELIAQPRVRITDITNRLTASCSPVFVEVEIPIDSEPLDQPLPEVSSLELGVKLNESLTVRRSKRSDSEYYYGATEMTCDESRCRKIYCTIQDMHENSGVTFEVFARPWNSTLRDIGFSEFSVTSILAGQIKQLQYNVDPSFMEPCIIKVTTMINLIGIERISIIPLWIIILSICFGLLILFAIAVCLSKLGFFDRKRPPTSVDSAAYPTQYSDSSPYSYRKNSNSKI